MHTLAGGGGGGACVPATPWPCMHALQLVAYHTCTHVQAGSHHFLLHACMASLAVLVHGTGPQGPPSIAHRDSPAIAPPVSSGVFYPQVFPRLFILAPPPLKHQQTRSLPHGCLQQHAHSSTHTHSRRGSYWPRWQAKEDLLHLPGHQEAEGHLHRGARCAHTRATHTRINCPATVSLCLAAPQARLSTHMCSSRAPCYALSGGVRGAQCHMTGIVGSSRVGARPWEPRRTLAQLLGAAACNLCLHAIMACSL